MVKHTKPRANLPQDVSRSYFGPRFTAIVAVWTFILTPDVEPTNNAAERALRPAVLWRKGSFGTQSDKGQRFVERMLSVATTARQQGIQLLDFLYSACLAQQQQKPLPVLFANQTG